MTDVSGPDEALQANRAGRLTEDQGDYVKAILERRVGGGRLIGSVFRHATGMAKDVEDGRVESIEGAVRKRRSSYGVLNPKTGNASATWYWIAVANREQGKQEFRASARLYDETPDAGMVRLYYLPRSKWAVNVELLPDVPLDDVSPEGAFGILRGAATALRRRDKVGVMESMAQGAALGHKLDDYLVPDAPAPAAPADPAQLSAAIVGSWTSPFLTVTFRDDGTLMASIPGAGEQSGRWAVEPDGRLRAEMMGGEQVADASVDGDTLTLTADGQAMRLERAQR